MKRLFFSLLIIYMPFQDFCQTPKVVAGRINHLTQFSSSFVSPRNIDIWLPENYSDTSLYPVLYMHDGQMLFDPDSTWNKQSWNADDVATDLFRKKVIQEFIIVGIWNSGAGRHADYFPRKVFESLSPSEKDTVSNRLQTAGRTKGTFNPTSDDYLKFIVQELKPYVDQHYRTRKERGYTFISGSSMGGLISLYAICEYPDVFGGAACLSTHWPGIFTLENNPVPEAMIRYLKQSLPNPENHKIYFDCGDQTLDALYPAIQKQVDKLMKEKGFDERHWKTMYVPGDDHSETSWNKRLHIPMEFLMMTGQ